MAWPSAVLAIIVAQGSPATQSPDQRPAFPAAVEMVKVDALVKDSSGKPVRGLQRGDFAIFEDGVRQDIDSFEAVEPPPVAVPPRAPDGVSTNVRPEGSAQPAHFVFLFDDVHIAPFRAERAIRAIKSFVETHALPADRVTIATSAGSQVWTGRVDDAREQLLAQLGSLTGRRTKDPDEDDVTELEAFLIVERKDKEALRRATERMRRRWNVPKTSDRALEAARAEAPALRAENQARSVLGSARMRTRATLGTVEWLLRGLGGTGGRKTLILLSEGFFYDPGLPEFRRVARAAHRTTTVVYNVDLTGPAAPDLQVEARGTPDLAPSNFDFEAQATQGSESVASETGGFTIKNTARLAAGMLRIAEDARTYYLLGYHPKNTAPNGKLRRIEVRLKEEGYGVQARKGYYASGGETPPHPSREPLDLGAEIPIRVMTQVLTPEEGGTTRVRLVAEVDPAGLRFEEADRVLTATLESSTRVTAGSEEAAEPQEHRAKIRIPAEDLAEVRSTWLPLTRDVSLAPGSYQARLSVKDAATGHRGTVRHSFDVPPPSAFRLTTPILTDRLLPDGGGQEVARRRFAPGSRLLCEFEVVGARRDGTGAGQVSAGFLLEGADGAVLARSDATPIAPTPDGRLPRRFAVNLKSLPPGEYAILLTARDEVAGRDLTLREPFVIEAAKSALVPAPASLPDLLDAYRQGNRREAVAAVAGWPEDHITASLRGIESGAVACPSPCLRATLLLELEVSALQRDRRKEKEANLHLDQARKLAPRLLEEPGNEAFLRDWLLAAGLSLGGTKRATAIDLFSECARRFEKDADCHLAVGAVHEEEALAPGPARQGAFGLLPSTARFPKDTKASLRAEKAYQRALALAPESDEAHLRLGRYWQRRGEPKRAEPELRWVLDHSRVTHYRVLARLFLGRLAEARNHFQDAAQQYRAAAEEEPTCQAARVALSRALLRSGQRREAIETARAALTAPDDPEAIESWLAYRMNTIHEFERRMRSLTGQVQLP